MHSVGSAHTRRCKCERETGPEKKNPEGMEEKKKEMTMCILFCALDCPLWLLYLSLCFDLRLLAVLITTHKIEANRKETRNNVKRRWSD